MRNQGSAHEEHSCVAYWWEQGKGSKLTLPGALTAFLRPHQSQPSPHWAPALAGLDPEQSPTRLRAAILEWGAHWSGTEPAWTYHSIQTLRVAFLDQTQIQPLGLLF